MKKLLLFCFSTFFYFSSLSQHVQFEWAKGFGQNGAHNDHCYGIALSNAGDLYGVGEFWVTVDFDPGPNIVNVTANGNRDAFIEKLDSNGNFVWVRTVSGPSFVRGTSVAVDDSGNVYVAGVFTDTIDLDPGLNQHQVGSLGAVDVFVIKLDASGNHVWSKTFGGPRDEFVNVIRLDRRNNVYLAGFFSDSVDFDPGLGVNLLTSPGIPGSYVLKLNNAGEFVWAGVMGGSQGAYARHLDIGLNDMIYVTGGFLGIGDFDPGPAVHNLSSSGNADVFIEKLDSNGNFIWARSFGGTGLEESFSIETDASSNIYTSGAFQNTVDFDPGSGTFSASANGYNDIYIHKLDSNGNFVWAKTIGAGGIESASSIVVDAAQDVYFTGQFFQTMDFDPGVGVHMGSSNGSDDFYIEKLNSNGDFQWVEIFGGVFQDQPSELVVDNAGAIYTMGRASSDSVDFDPGPAVSSVNFSRNYDVFAQKLSKCTVVNGTDQQVSCGPFTWIDSVTYTSSNSSATHLIEGGASSGCDSLVTLDLTVLNALQTGIDYRVSCDSLQWIDSLTYYTDNNTATHLIKNGAANGCDSLVRLNLVMNYSSTSVDTQRQCNSFTWIDGITYTSNNNTASYQLVGSAGCDSVILLDLTLVNIDTSLSVQNSVIAANTSGLTYQWLDCANGYSQISGATSQFYAPQASGTYAIEIRDGICVDTSECTAMVFVGIEDRIAGNDIKIYPNPSEGEFLVYLGDLEPSLIEVFDQYGKQLMKVANINEPVFRFQLEEPAGFYFLQLTTATGQVEQFKLVKR